MSYLARYEVNCDWVSDVTDQSIDEIFPINFCLFYDKKQLLASKLADKFRLLRFSQRGHSCTTGTFRRRSEPHIFKQILYFSAYGAGCLQPERQLPPYTQSHPEYLLQISEAIVVLA